MSDDATQLKEQGNEAFKAQQYDKAIEKYTKCIEVLNGGQSPELAVCLKNRAAAYLKLEQYEQALKDCDQSDAIAPHDPKTLFRRCQALEQLEKYDEAYRDATSIFKDDPANKAIQPVLQRLYKKVQDLQQHYATTQNKLTKMCEILFDIAGDTEKREQAVNNILVLARQKSAVDLLLKSQLLQQIQKLLKVEKNQEIWLTAVRVVGELCKHSDKNSLHVMKTLGLPWFLETADSDCEKRVNVVQWCMQTVLNSLSGMDIKSDKKPDQQLMEQHKSTIDTLLTCVLCSINKPALCAKARDALIELITRNVHYTALNWAEDLLDKGGILRLMDCASELEEFQYESKMPITPSTRTLAALALSRVYENMYYDALKAKFLQKIDDYLQEKLLQADFESKIRATVALTSLLRGPFDVGNQIISRPGIIEMVLVMANSDDVLQQKVACECIIAASSKADKAKTILAQGCEILKNLYKTSKEDEIRVRALVGLCKLGAMGGSDSSARPFPEGSTVKLAEACRRFLLHPKKGGDVRKFAAEGLSYLTLDAEVKEHLIEDKPALRSLINLASSGDQSCVYGVVTTLVNLCNAYEKQEVMPEMLELAKFAKQHVPQEHELDDEDFVRKRIMHLGGENVTSALVALSKTDSENAKELIARVFNALCSEQDLRGLVVQQGGVKVLIQLALKGTQKGKIHAAQALARIGITTNPEIAFPGQRALETVRPLISLLQPDCSALENFEALMALCNLAQLSAPARKRILDEGGFGKIEHYMFEDHELLCRAAAQTMCNMCLSPDVVSIFEGENDRVKFCVGLCLEQDRDTVVAASGIVAILTAESEKCCEKVFESRNWLDALHALLANSDKDIQFRGMCIVQNMVTLSKTCTEKLMETDIMELCMVFTKLENTVLVEIAEDILKNAENWGIIKRPEAQADEE